MTMMRTIEMKEPGGPDVLRLGERPIPKVGDGEVLVKVTAAGVNGPDIVQRRGHYPPPPGASDLLGLEISGEITGVGNGVEHWSPGNNVCALTNGGGYAEYVTVPAGQCLPVPEGVSVHDAAGICETFFTVWSNCFYQKTHAPDAVLLVHGGAGGIGSTTIQLGAALGLRVFATCSEDDRAFCVAAGAERAIDYRNEDFVEIVREAGGASMILDIIGGDYVERNFKAAAQDAHIIQLAFNRGSKVDVNLMPIMLKRLVLTGSTLRPRPPEFKASIAASLRDNVWQLFAAGKMNLHIHEALPFGEAQRAHEMMERGDHRGKILLVLN